MRINYYIIFIILFFLSASCSRFQTQPFIIGTNNWIGYQPLYLAARLGYYRNSSVKLSMFLSASDVMKAYRNGQLHGAAVTLDEAISLADEGFRFHIVAVFNISHGADAIIGGPGVKRMADLKGKKIGAEQGALGAFVVARALEKSGMSENDVQIVPADPETQIEAFLSRRVNAVACFDPVRSELLERHKGSLLFDSSQIPGEIIDILIIDEKYINSHEKQISSLLTGWSRAVQPGIFRKEENLQFMAEHMGISTSEFEKSLGLIQIPGVSKNYAMLYPGYNNGVTVAGSAKKLTEIMKRNNLIQSSDPQKNFTINADFIKFIYNNPLLYRPSPDGGTGNAADD